MIAWKTCQRDFAWDGSWRDVYVLNTTVEDWRLVWAHLRARFELEYSTDGLIQPPPESLDHVFQIRAQANPHLTFRVRDIRFACHFFGPEQIEFDFDPREVKGQVDLDALLDFLKQLGNVTGKSVTVTPENCSENPIISYDPKIGASRFHEIAN